MKLREIGLGLAMLLMSVCIVQAAGITRILIDEPGESIASYAFDPSVGDGTLSITADDTSVGFTLDGLPGRVHDVDFSLTASGLTDESAGVIARGRFSEVSLLLARTSGEVLLNAWGGSAVYTEAPGINAFVLAFDTFSVVDGAWAVFLDSPGLDGVGLILDPDPNTTEINDLSGTHQGGALFSIRVIPEPATCALFALGMVLIVRRRWKAGA